MEIKPKATDIEIQLAHKNEQESPDGIKLHKMLRPKCRSFLKVATEMCDNDYTCSCCRIEWISATAHCDCGYSKRYCEYGIDELITSMSLLLNKIVKDIGYEWLYTYL